MADIANLKMNQLSNVERLILCESMKELIKVVDRELGIKIHG